MIELEWHGLYGDGWKNEIVPDAFTHPAKYSRALIRHIYEYLMQEDMIHGGDTVLDPFGGVALGGLDAMRLGLHWVGVELEPKFVALGIQNIALWNSRYAGRLQRWGTARLLQGDSRNLRSVIEAAGCAVSSPPFIGTGVPDHEGQTDSLKGGKLRGGGIKFLDASYGTTPGNLGNLREGDYRAAISSPPYSNQVIRDREIGDGHSQGATQGKHSFDAYGHTDGQLASMPEGKIDAAISSPPYEEARIGQESGQEHCGRGDQYGATAGQLGAMKGDGFKAAVSSPPFSVRQPPCDARPGEDTELRDVKADTYGSTEGQLGAMRGNGYDAAVSSPPFQNSDSRKPGPALAQSCEKHHVGTSHHKQDVELRSDNLGNSQGDDFWSAARQVVSETYAVLAPGAPAVWVVKSFVRNKQIVDFPDQWRQLCEACGFSTYAIARAWLVEDYGMQTAMDGNHKKYRKERKSFFRRLAESKGSPRIDWEMVLIMRKVTPEAKTLTDT